MASRGFGYVVDSCPISQEETTESASRLNCSVDENERNQYVCVPNQDLTSLVEFCYTKTIVGLYEIGHCLRTVNDGFLDQISCKSFTEGCPAEYFRSTDLYKYPACHRLNTEDRCFVADPSCNASTVLGVLNMTTDNTSYFNATTIAVDDGSINVGAIVGVVSLLILAWILIVAFVFWRRRKGLKRNRRNLERRNETESLLGESFEPETVSQKRRNETESLLGESFEPETVSQKREEEMVISLIPEDSSISIHHKTGDYSVWKTPISESTLEMDSLLFEDHLHDTGISIHHKTGDYSVWKTPISDQFSILTDDKVSVLFCFMCSDSGPPDFTDAEWLDMLNEIRQKVYHKEDPVTSEEAQQTLDRLKSRYFLWEDQKKKHLTEEAQDEIMYRASKRVYDIDVVFYFPSFITAQRYLRPGGYNRKPGEKCVGDYGSYGVYSVYSDPLLIRRLQMNILTHVTMKDRRIFNKVSQILNIPLNIVDRSKKEREKFRQQLKETGESVHYRGRSQDSVQHVTWLWRYRDNARPDIVRSCIGLHPHNDIYIIDNKAYRKPSRYHAYPPGVRCLLYCLLLVDHYTLDVNERPHETLLSKLKERYFTDLLSIDDIILSGVPDGIIDKQGSKLKFKSDDIRHDVMYAFVTECLVEDSDLEFFLSTASRDVISEYCRSWEYKRSDRERKRCLYVPDRPDKMYDFFIDKLQLDIITHCTVSDRSIHDSIRKGLGVPKEVLRWDLEARERYVEYAKRGTQTVHHARGMIVGCAGAGKTTLLKRLMGCTEEELRNVKSTEGLEVHEEIFQIEDETKTLKAFPLNEDDKKDGSFNKRQNAKTLTFFDFGGQCAYYACHQIYLTRRAFYVVVVDASKSLDQPVDKAVCDQDGSVFSGWTYGDYFVFWLKSIHTYCNAKNKEDQKPIVLIVATHWDVKNKQYKDKYDFMENLLRQLPSGSHLLQYIKEDNCYCVQFPVPLHDLEKRIADIASQSRWTENTPKEWVFFEIHLQQTKEKILETSSIRVEINATENDDVAVESRNDKTMRKQDMLRFYHDAGKVLYFNEDGLREFVITDVQWFVDAFKNIITDKLHLKGIDGTVDDWKEYYQTGNLRDGLLEKIWEDTKRSEALLRKKEVLNFMQRLGLMAVGTESHYVPCMNRKEMERKIQKIILKSKSKSSVLVYQFDILPFFFFFRLVVACMLEKGWNVLRSNDGISYLYKNAALFFCEQNNILLSATADSVQLQVLHSVSGQTLDEEKTRQIQATVERLLTAITETFHRKLMFGRGIRCQEDKGKPFAMAIQGYLLEDKNTIQWEDKNDQVCPLHRMPDPHFINTFQLKKYWKF